MKGFILFLYSIPPLLVLFISIAVVHNSEFKITKGSSLSTSSLDSTHWLSPSGTVAFGFYPLCPEDCDSYVVGIWFVKSTDKTLVWVANRNDPPLNGSSSILLNHGGELILRTSGGKTTPLLGEVSRPVSYAVMHDNGNFVLYGYNSQIIWQSFDHPTHTILGGQQLSGDQRLISDVSTFNHSHGSYVLKIREDFAISKYDDYSDSETEIASLTLNLDSITGRMYITDRNNSVLKNFTKGENRTQLDNNLIYRATLGIDGIFSLYKERIESDSERSVLVWESISSPRRSYYSVLAAISDIKVMVKNQFLNRNLFEEEDIAH